MVIYNALNWSEVMLRAQCTITEKEYQLGVWKTKIFTYENIYERYELKKIEVINHVNYVNKNVFRAALNSEIDVLRIWMGSLYQRKGPAWAKEWSPRRCEYVGWQAGQNQMILGALADYMDIANRWCTVERYHINSDKPAVTACTESIQPQEASAEKAEWE